MHLANRTQVSTLESAVPIGRLIHWITGFRRRRRRKLRARPFPPPWRGILERRSGSWRRLGPADRAELLGHIQVFLAEKNFEGCGGLAITDEIRVTIAAEACVLLLHREDEYFPLLRSVLVYPTEYVAPTLEHLDDGTVAEDHQPRLGESWDQGSLVLSWADVLSGAENARDGHNVVLHEFAHQIDEQYGLSEADPRTAPNDAARQWAEVFGRAFDRFVGEVHRGRAGPIDPYGATNEAEFFAVVTETFFERPADLRRYDTDLYDQWSRFYRQDPISWRS